MWQWVKQNKFKTFLVGLLVVFVLNSIFRSNNPIVAVKTITTSEKVVEKSLSVSGEVKSRNQADLAFQSGGQILKIYVKEGDTVQKGQLLAQLNNSSQYYDIQALKDARDVAARDLDLYIEQNVDDNKGDDDYEIAVRRLKELLSKAQATYDSGLASLSNTYIYAPFDGTIVDIPASEGETVAATGTVMTVVDEGQLIFEAQVDQEDFGAISKDMHINIELDAYPTETFDGVIEYLPAFVNTSTGNFVLDIAFVDYADKPHKPVTGMVGDAHVVLSSTQTPVQALVFDELYYDEEDQPYVWVLENGKVKKQVLETGLEGDLYTEVKTDLSNQKVVKPIKADDEIDEGYAARVSNE